MNASETEAMSTGPEETGVNADPTGTETAGTGQTETESGAGQTEPEVSAVVKENAAALLVFRLVAPEFSGVDDETVCLWFNLTAPMVSRKQFGKLYDQAIALMAAHRMKLSGKYEDTAEDSGEGMQLGSIADTLRVSSYSEGGTSVSFNNSVSLLEKDADMALSTYGTQYLSLRRQVIIPIRCSGEAR